MEKEPRLLVGALLTETGLLTIDVLEIGADLWLVPEWYTANNGSLQTPVRAIRGTSLAHQRLQDGHPTGRQVVWAQPIPKAVLDGDIARTAELGYELVVPRNPGDEFGWIPARQGH